MNYTNIWLGSLSLLLAGIAHLRTDIYARNIGALCLFSVALAAILLPKQPKGAVGHSSYFLARLCGWFLVGFMSFGVTDYATYGLSTELLTFAWEMIL